MGKNRRRFLFENSAALFLLFLLPFRPCVAQQPKAIGFKWFTVAGNADAGYRKTQFFEQDYNTAVVQWDTRASFWLPPFRTQFSWGPYIRAAGIKSSQTEPWENAWLASPGFGFQLFPISSPKFQGKDNKIGSVLGPLRLYAEYNFTDYFGKENAWRPTKQISAGADYWKALHVNNTASLWWGETWNGLRWQSSNEFDNSYDTLIFANAARFGIRKPKTRFVSALTPYLLLENTLTNRHRYYWENRLLVGAGLRIAPSGGRLPAWLNRFVIYGEYQNTAAYYAASAPSSIPRFDIRFGISASVGDWYRAVGGSAPGVGTRVSKANP